MFPQAVANTIWSYATMGLMPVPEACTILDAAVARVAQLGRAG